MFSGMKEEISTITKQKAAPVQSVARALGILECFYEHNELRLTDISHMLNLNKSTTHGLVKTLESFGFLSQNKENEKYKLGAAIFRLGNNMDSSLRSLAKISLATLVQEFGETANLSVRVGDKNMFLEKLESPFSMRISTSLGQMFPLYLTAMGQCMLAYLSEDEINSILAHTEYVRYTEKSLMSSEEVLIQLKDIRENGFSIDDEERECGLICVAVPIFDEKNEVMAALSVSGPTLRMTQAKISAIISKLRQEAHKLQKSLISLK